LDVVVVVVVAAAKNDNDCGNDHYYDINKVKGKCHPRKGHEVPEGE
jgi:hypothetical protein